MLVNLEENFLNVEDLAKAILFLMKKNIKQDFLNIGSGEDYSIIELAKLIKKIINYKGKTMLNKKYPDGIKN